MPNTIPEQPDMNRAPQDFTIDGKCSRCGECCTDRFSISQKEIRHIRTYIKTHGIKPVSHVPAVYNGPVLDLVCPFLDTTRTPHVCNIYAVRPAVCKHFICHAFADDETYKHMMMHMSKDKEAVEAAASPLASMWATFFPDDVHMRLKR